MGGRQEKSMGFILGSFNNLRYLLHQGHTSCLRNRLLTPGLDTGGVNAGKCHCCSSMEQKKGDNQGQVRALNGYWFCKITAACEKWSKAAAALSFMTTPAGKGCPIKDKAPALLAAGGVGPAAGKTLHNSFPSLLYKQVPFLILFHHNIHVMLMTQQDEKLTSL